MGYMGFGMKPELYKRKPKKFMGKRTGLFGRQLKDELKENYHHDQIEDKPHLPAKEKRKKIFYKGGPDRVIELVVLGLIVAVVLFFFFTWKFI